jgi:hypothetical protein
MDRARPKSVTFGTPVACQEDIGGFEVPVNEAALVRELHGTGQRGDHFGRLPCGLRTACELLCQSSSLDKLHREVRPTGQVADIVDLYDVRMPQCRHRLGLAPETPQFLRIGVSAGEQHLDGDDALELEVLGLEDDAYAAPAEDGLHVIAVDLR